LVLLYHIGKIVGGSIVGLYSAFFWAISPYGITYSTMVRPYPFATCLALLATVLVLTLSSPVPGHVLHRRRVWSDGGIILMGIYTIYHFLFVVIFQIFFLLFTYWRKRTALILMAITFGIVAIFYVPWLPALRTQLSVVNFGESYFSGRVGLSTIINSILGFNFAHFPPGFETPLAKLSFVSVPLFLTLWGYRKSLQQPIGRIFALAIISSMATNIGVDLLLRTNTLGVPKLQFFFAPVALIFLSMGIAHLSHQHVIRHVMALVSTGLLVFSAIPLYRSKPFFDGPKCLVETYPHLSTAMDGTRQPQLFMVNTARRRHLFPLLHLLRPREVSDVYIKPEDETARWPESAKAYQTITLVYCSTPDHQIAVRTEDRHTIIASAHQAGFQLIQEKQGEASGLFVFEATTSQ